MFTRIHREDVTQLHTDHNGMSIMDESMSHQTRGVTKLDGAPGQETSLSLPCTNLRSFGNKCTQCQMSLLGALRHNFSTAPIFSLKTNVARCPHNTPVHHAK